MRFKNLCTAAVSIMIIGSPLVFASQAKAAAATETLKSGLNSNLCVSDNGVNLTSNPKLLLESCDTSVGYDTFHATASSYGSGWYSIVTNDTNGSSGSFCITGVATKGTQMFLEGCNGGNLQAFKKVCFSDGQTELENAASVAMDDYGAQTTAGAPVVSWPFESSPSSASLIFNESAHDMGSCS